MLAPVMSDGSFEVHIRDDGGVVLHLIGHWTLRAALPDREAVMAALGEQDGAGVSFDTERLEAWDTRLIGVVAAVADQCQARERAIDLGKLPEGVRSLFDLTRAVPDRDLHHTAIPQGFLHVVGREALGFVRSAGELLAFSGEVVAALSRLVRGRAQMRGKDLLSVMQEVGAEALPIVSLISVLVGLIFAYIGALQLQQLLAPRH